MAPRKWTARRGPTTRAASKKQLGKLRSAFRPPSKLPKFRPALRSGKRRHKDSKQDVPASTDVPSKRKASGNEEKACKKKSKKQKKSESEKSEPEDEMVDDQKSTSNNTQLDDNCCDLCLQPLSTIDICEENLAHGLSEEEALSKEHENVTLSCEDLPQFNVTDFTIYDKCRHLCSMENRLIETGVQLFVNCYLTSTDETLPKMDPLPMNDAGPITEWALEGYDGKKDNYFVITTDLGEYRLQEPSLKYAPYMTGMYGMKATTKAVIEYIEANDHLMPTYSQLLDAIKEKIVPETNVKITEDMLVTHSYYICEVASTFQREDGEMKLMNLPCMRELSKISGFVFKERKQKTILPKQEKDARKVNLKSNNHISHEVCEEPDGDYKWSKATTTPLVRKYFDKLFSDELDKYDIDTSKACPNQELKLNETDIGKKLIENTDEGNVNNSFDQVRYKSIEWIGDRTADDDYIYYEKCKVAGTLFKVGDFVTIKTTSKLVPPLIGRIMFMYKDSSDRGLCYFHAQLFIRSSDTVLGDIGHLRELFLTNDCHHDIPLVSIIDRVNVVYKPIVEIFKTQHTDYEEDKENDGENFFYKMYYDKFTARFEDIPLNLLCIKDHTCPSCEKRTIEDFQYAPMVYGKLETHHNYESNSKKTYWKSVIFMQSTYTKNCTVFLNPHAFSMPDSFRKRCENLQKKEKVDEVKFPESYRKNKKELHHFSFTARRTFHIGIIEEVFSRGWSELIAPQDIYIRIRVMYRPENTTCRNPHHKDLNEVYWSDRIEEVPFKFVIGQCELYYKGNILKRMTQEWLEEDPNRFYFFESYDHTKGKIRKLTDEARKFLGNSSSQINDTSNILEQPHDKLISLDLFAGCGGLSDGFHQAGIVDCKWAIEIDEEAAKAFSQNFKDCTVICADANTVLKEIMAGERSWKNGQSLPKKGQVDMICGGPPCQGFSGMNRFNTRAYSAFKNSLVVTFLAYCDYFRPKYIVMENVRNFVSFKKGLAVKLLLHSLLAMGYQCTFAVLQAGCYGIAQTRRRVIVLASAPGYKLPMYPEPTNVFNRVGCRVSVNIDGKLFTNNIQTFRWAPRRSCTIYDVLSDLPPIESGESSLEMDYDVAPQTHFQRMVRRSNENAQLTDHICKKMSPLVQARIENIPKTPGADWRDLPNIKLKLSDGSTCKVLKYLYSDRKKGSSKTGNHRGVCPCASGKKCDPTCKQDNTLIPWGMAHTANRYNNWNGIYGRLSWFNYFRTTVTDPEPSGKQGRVLHPEQDRVLSVKECARSQGFKDSFRFSGTVQDRHRQIGNAVPPPLAAAIGREIKKALARSSTSQQA